MTAPRLFSRKQRNDCTIDCSTGSPKRHVQDWERIAGLSSRLRRHADYRQRSLGRTGGQVCCAGSFTAHPGPGHQFHRYRRFLWPARIRTVDRRGLASIPRGFGDCHQGGIATPRSRTMDRGRPAGTSAPHAKEASAGCVCSESISTSFIASTPRSRSKIKSEPCSISSERARSGTLACRKSV